MDGLRESAFQSAAKTHQSHRYLNRVPLHEGIGLARDALVRALTPKNAVR
jgi:hypothetical protein